MTDFLARYRVENRMGLFRNFMRCNDRKKKMYFPVKIISKKDLKPEIKMFL